MPEQIRVTPSPHISQRLTTRTVMLDVIIALVPAIIAGVIYFRIYAPLLISVCVISAMLTEWLCNLLRGRTGSHRSLGDFSAVLTGIILALSVPPELPIWAAVIGSVFAIAIGKMVFGGLGSNIFNPAMVGRAFLTASFGVLMTTWTVPATINPDMGTISAENKVDARTQATPLAQSKDAIKTDREAAVANRQLPYLFKGSVGGCLGETSALALLTGGIYLLIRRTINWRIPAGVFLSSFVFASIFYFYDPASYITPQAHLFAGGLMIGAFFIATDPVTAPLSGWGMWIFGLGVGTITMLIRIVGEYPEGVMFSVLLMNSVTPLIDRLCKKVPTGGEPR